MKPKTILLDVGCGNGNYLIDENRRKIYWAVGIDPDKNAVSKNQCLDKIVVGNVEKMPFKSGEFDIVTSLWLLEHLKNPQKAFSEIHRILKPDGIFIFVTPNYNYLPLKIIHLIKSSQINHLLNKVLFGRKKDDVFEAFYKASTLKGIRRLTKGKYKEIELRLNYDPSYTSFNALTFNLTNVISSVINKLGFDMANSHIVGILQRS